MKSSTQEIGNKIGYGGLHGLQGPAWDVTAGSSNLHYVLFGRRLALTISKVKVHQTGLDLVVSLGFSNAEHLYIPPPYLQTFLHKLNTASTKFSYAFSQESSSLILACALPPAALIDSAATLSAACSLLQQDSKILEEVLEVIGILKPKGKKSLTLKKAQLSLKKTVAQQIMANKDCSKTNAPSQPNAPIFQAKRIVELPNQFSQDAKPKKGGYFQVQKVQCKVIDTFGNETIEDLACKTARNSKKQGPSETPKLQKQISLASMIHDPTHFVKYYVEETKTENQHQKLYMEFIPELLKHRLYKSSLSALDLIKLSKQFIHAVGVMHESGIVHRDLKPENILIEQKNGELGLKIIDFGESATTCEEYNRNHFLGCTLPYSPIECMSRTEAGFNKPEIDLWSLSMILYEMTFQGLPMFYSRCIGPEIVESWRIKKDFSIFPLYRRRRGYRAVEEIISLVSICGLQCDQQSRLKINSLKGVFQAVEDYTRAV